MARQRRCQFCGDDISHRAPQARNCSDSCKIKYSEAKAAGTLHLVPAVAGNATVLVLPTAGGGQSVQPAGKHDPDDDESITYATRRDLRAANREATPLGRTALKIASQLDNPGANTLSAVASLAKQFHEIMGMALADAESAVDPIDELRRIRDEKQRAASGD